MANHSHITKPFKTPTVRERIVALLERTGDTWLTSSAIATRAQVIDRRGGSVGTVLNALVKEGLAEKRKDPAGGQAYEWRWKKAP